MSSQVVQFFYTNVWSGLAIFLQKLSSSSEAIFFYKFLVGLSNFLIQMSCRVVQFSYTNVLSGRAVFLHKCLVGPNNVGPSNFLQMSSRVVQFSYTNVWSGRAIFLYKCLVGFHNFLRTERFSHLFSGFV